MELRYIKDWDRDPTHAQLLCGARRVIYLVNNAYRTRARVQVTAHHQGKLVCAQNVVGLDCTLQPATNVSNLSQGLRFLAIVS